MKHQKPKVGASGIAGRCPRSRRARWGLPEARRWLAGARRSPELATDGLRASEGDALHLVGREDEDGLTMSDPDSH